MWEHRWVTLIVCLNNVLVGSQQATPSYVHRDYDIERLPKNVIPSHYDLHLEVNLPGYAANFPKEVEFTTVGTVTIDFTVTEPTTIVKLNVADPVRIKAIYATILSPEFEEGEWSKLKNFTVDANVEVMTIWFEDELPAELNYKLKILFDGEITEKQEGLYYVANSGSNGIEYSAITMFEDIFARQMVPCFDEPSFKATWKLTVVHPLGTDAISNGELSEQTVLKDRNLMISVFDNSPYMSSYVLALSVSNFIFETGYTQKGIRVRCFVHKSSEGKALKQAVQYTIKSMETLEEMFDYSPFEKKLDFVFTSIYHGGLESWNLITLDEQRFYMPSGNDVKNCKIARGVRAEFNNFFTNPENMHDYGIATIAHELTHQWFGNLVTHEWWSELWLTEGITTYVTCYVAEQINGVVKRDDCIFKDQEWALTKKYADRLEPEVINRLEIDIQFGTVYAKGGSLARMLEEIVGYSNMIEGLKNYIHDHLYQNVDRYRLVSALQSFTRVNLTRLVDQWTTQIGYPIVHVEQVEKNIFKLTQSVVCGNETNLEKFDIPIFEKDSIYEEILMLNADTEYIHLMTNGEWPIINGKNAGGYRVDYGKGWDSVNDNSYLTPLERSKLMKDLIVIHLNDQKEENSIEEPLKITEPLGKHNEKLEFTDKLSRKRNQRT